MFPGLRSPLPDAVKITAGDRHVRAVALEAESIRGLRFVVPSFSCGRAQWTRVVHADIGLARGAHRELGRRREDLRAREASRPPEAEGRRERATNSTGPPRDEEFHHVSLVMCLERAIGGRSRVFAGRWRRNATR